MSKFEKSNYGGAHEIMSDSVLLCKDTGRVVAVFYSESDLDAVLSTNHAVKLAELLEEASHSCLNVNDILPRIDKALTNYEKSLK